MKEYESKRRHFIRQVGVATAGLSISPSLIFSKNMNENPIVVVAQNGTPEQMIEAGRKVKEAGIELSEYLMLGLGGADGWESHARESAAVLNAIDPDFIRLRTMTLIPGTPLFEAYESGEYKPANVLEMLLEERLLIECFEGISSEFHSDHVSNLVSLFGKLMEDKEMLVHIYPLSLHPNGRRIAFQKGDSHKDFWLMENLFPTSTADK